MITVDRRRCAYCGGCVSVCPVEAISLAETRLHIDESCIECEDCLAACPTGALGLAQASPKTSLQAMPLPSRYDLVVVGAGPGGSTAAQAAAQAGLSTLLLEKRQEIGSPVRCAEGVSHPLLLPFIEPDPLWVAAKVDKAEISAVAGGQTRALRASGGQGYVLERRVFDRVLAERAAQAGAEVRVKTAAVGLLQEDGQLRGLRIRLSDGTEVEVGARLVIAADGVEAQVGRWAGLDTQLPLQDTMVCAQYLLAGVKIDPTCTYYVIDPELVPGGYAWVFPKGEGKANVGLGVQADLWSQAKGESESVLSRLDRFVEARPSLAQGYPVTLVAGNVPVALPPAPLVTNGLMLVGDAARQVDPLTGGGIVNAMSAGKLAAQVAAEAIAAGDVSAEFLSRYEREWSQSIGRKMARNYRLRLKFPPSQWTDEKFIRAFALAVAG